MARNLLSTPETGTPPEMDIQLTPKMAESDDTLLAASRACANALQHHSQSVRTKGIDFIQSSTLFRLALHDEVKSQCWTPTAQPVPPTTTPWVTVTRKYTRARARPANNRRARRLANTEVQARARAHRAHGQHPTPHTHPAAPAAATSSGRTAPAATPPAPAVHELPASPPATHPAPPVRALPPLTDLITAANPAICRCGKSIRTAQWLHYFAYRCAHF